MTNDLCSLETEIFGQVEDGLVNAFERLGLQSLLEKIVEKAYAIGDGFREEDAQAVVELAEQIIDQFQKREENISLKEEENEQSLIIKI